MATHYPFAVFPDRPWQPATRRALEALGPVGLGIGIHYRQRQNMNGYEQTAKYTIITRKDGAGSIGRILESPDIDAATAALAAMHCIEDEVVSGVTRKAFGTLPWESQFPSVLGAYFPDGAVFCRLRPIIHTRNDTPAEIPARVATDLLGYIPPGLSGHGRIGPMSRIAEIAEIAFGPIPDDVRLAPDLHTV